jgi:DNA polymerase III sliding clamp (beta) subunit (PCNA family)
MPKRINSAPAVVTNLAEALEAVGYAVAKDETRPVLAGAYLDGKAGIVAAADGFRLATSALKVRGKGKLPCAILAGAVVPVIKSIFVGSVSIASRQVKVSNTKDTNTFVQFECGHRLLMTMAVRGNFPQYSQLIPKGGTIVRFDRDEMKAAIKLMLIANPSNYLTRFISKGHNLMVFTLLEDNRTEMAVASKGKVKIAFDARFVRDILNNLPQGEVVMRTTAPQSPALFRANGNLHVVMPMFCAETIPPPKPVTPEPISHPCSASTEAVKQAEEIVAEASKPVQVVVTG